MSILARLHVSCYNKSATIKKSKVNDFYICSPIK